MSIWSMNIKALVVSILIFWCYKVSGQLEGSVKMGCFKDYDDGSQRRVMGEIKIIRNLTLEKCRDYCMNNNKETTTFFGAAWYFECYCSNVYATLESLPESRCSIYCEGNENQMCGGDKALSVYTVCPKGRHGPKCKVMCGHCKNMSVGCVRNKGACFDPGVCEDGWQGDNCKTDIDECRSGNHSCSKLPESECVNTAGGYNCTCKYGFKYNEHGGAKSCDDINECLENKGGCEQECNNTAGSFNCYCRTGYKINYGNTSACDDVDECRDGTRRCDHECINTIGSYQCYCRDGYTTNTSDWRLCDDIDECSMNKGGCDQTCTNTQGSYVCGCNTGFYLSATERHSCIDIDECNDRSKPHGCAHFCNNTAGSFFCSCQTGYSVSETDNKKCKDVNECLVENGGCSQLCNNTIGSFNCGCREGYDKDTEDSSKCNDINECEVSKGGCEHNCHNTKGSYSCSCYEGYYTNPNKHLCPDIDECAPEVRAKSCGGENMNCTNVPGAYICACSEGYILAEDKKHCYEPANTFLMAMVGLLVVLTVCGIILVVVLWRRRAQQAVKQQQFEGNGSPTVIVETKLDQKPLAPKVAARKKNYVNNNSSSQDALLSDGEDNNKSNGFEDDSEHAIYANFSPTKSARSPTRITINDLPELINRVRIMPKALDDEFKKLAENSGESFKFAEQKELKIKNRFKNILPYDGNRVKLNQIGKDIKTTYINASFVAGYKDPNKYIASHGPTKNTVSDFWRMVWEYNAYIIVMVTKCNEDLKMKCEQYWPEDAEPKTFDNDLSVKLLSAQFWLEHVIRKFTLTNTSTSQSREVTQLQYTAWPDHGVPHNSITLLTLRHKVNSLLVPSKKAPVIVHCSAGVGRTGTYIGLDNLLEEAEQVKEIDIHNTVMSLRKQRMNSVQTLDQYTFLFKAVYEGLLMGTTRIPTHQMSSKVSNLRATHHITGCPIIDTEFKMICEMQPLYTDEQCSDALSSVNKSKNRNSFTVPANSQRAAITSGDRNDYINAVYVATPFKSLGHIATQFPLKQTVGDFWAMCLDHDSTLVVVLSREGQDDDVLIDMLPQSGSWLRYKKFSVGDTQLLSQSGGASKSADGGHGCWEAYSVTIRQGSGGAASEPEALIYENTKQMTDAQEAKQQKKDESQEEDKEIKVRVLVSSLPRSVSGMGESLLRLSREVMGIVEREQIQAPVIATCSTGISLSGLYLSAYNCYSMIQSDDVVDVVQIVLDLKKAQPHFISTQDDYEQVYNIAEQCANQVSTYANVL